MLNRGLSRPHDRAGLTPHLHGVGPGAALARSVGACLIYIYTSSRNQEHIVRQIFVSLLCLLSTSATAENDETAFSDAVWLEDDIEENTVLAGCCTILDE